MADLSLKRKKGGDLPPAEIFELPVEPSLIFITGNQIDPYMFDLTMFATGLTAEEIAQRKGHHNLKRTKPFSARQQLIQELLPHIRTTHYYSASKTCIAIVDSLKWWWRLFDSCHDIAPVQSAADLDAIHYATYRVKPCARQSASTFFTLVAYCRDAQNLPPLYWTAVDIPSATADLVVHEDVRRLYTHFQQKCKILLIGYENDETITPKVQDLLNLHTLFIISTGWNPQVALDIDVSQTNPDGSLACISQDVQNPLYSVISSIKNRAGRTVQEAHGLNKQGYSCVNIIRALYRQTAPLRARVRADLDLLENRHEQIYKREVHVSQAEAHTLAMEIANLRAKIRSPWIYLGNKNKIQMYSIRVMSSALAPIKKATDYINEHLSVNAKPVAEGITVTDFRDAYISYRWHKGGYSWLATMMAAGHTKLASLQAYLNKRQHHQASQVSFLKVSNATWQTIADLPNNAAKSMTTVIAARVKGVPEEKVIEWLAGQNLTIQGVGCRDYKNPPRFIAPDHIPGSGCKPQRCLFCHTHAVLLPDSYIHIAKRLAELRYFQTTMSVLAWVESDYLVEMENAESALDLYDDVAVTEQLIYWEQEIREGRHIPMRMEGVYA